MQSRKLAAAFGHAAVLAIVLAPGAGCAPPGASFSPATGVLTIVGTGVDDMFLVRARANGTIVVNGGATPISGGVPTVANTLRIVLQGNGGDDVLGLDPTGGALPGARFRGGPGTDLLLGGPGDDEFVVAAGDGFDTVEGEAGADTLIVEGDNDDEDLDVDANGAHAAVSWSAGSATVDLLDVETIQVLAHGGRDTLAVRDLSGTDVTDVRLELASFSGGGDGRSDSITIDGTPGVDSVAVLDDAGAVRVQGLSATVHVSLPEPSDTLSIATFGGADLVDAAAAQPDVIALSIDTGLDPDAIVGSEGDDELAGGGAADIVFMGDGDDTFAWSPGDGDDTLEGQSGFDTLLFTGSDGSEDFEVSANGARALLFRSIGNVTADLNDVEAIDLLALGGADEVTVEDVDATDLIRVSVSLATAAGAGDGQPDAVLVKGSGDDDIALVTGGASAVSVFGLAAQVEITGAEDPTDELTVSTLGGEDIVEASGLATPSIAFTAEGGGLADVLIGGDGDDVLIGGEGDDTLLGGPGVDTLDGGGGNNILIQD